MGTETKTDITMPILTRGLRPIRSTVAPKKMNSGTARTKAPVVISSATVLGTSAERTRNVGM